MARVFKTLKEKSTTLVFASLLLASAIIAPLPAKADCRSDVFAQVADPGSYGYCFYTILATACNPNDNFDSHLEYQYICGGG